MFPTALSVYDVSGEKHLQITHDADYCHIHSFQNTNFHLNNDIHVPTKYENETGYINVADELRILKNMINSLTSSEPESEPEPNDFSWNHLGPATATGTSISQKSWFDLSRPLYDGKRFILDSSFITQIYNEMGDWSDFHIGLKGDDWNNTSVSNYYSTPYGYVFGLKLRFYKNAAQNANIMSITLDGNAQNSFYMDPEVNLYRLKGFIEITDNGNRLNFALSNSLSDNATTTTYNNWTGKKYTTFDIQRNFTSKDIIAYWSKAGNYSGTFDWSNITLDASNETDVP